MNKMNSRWTIQQIILALQLYIVTPYSKITSKNPEIVNLGKLLGRSPAAVSLKLSNLAACDIKGRSMGHKGSSHGSKLDAYVWNRYLIDNELDIEKINLDAELIKSEISIPENMQPELSRKNFVDDLPERNQECYYTIKGRRDQELFRKAVLANYESSCPFSNCQIPELIDAAHILSWNKFPEYRMKVSNGLALNKLIHTAFDKNMLGIDPDGQIVISSLLQSEVSGKACQQFFSQIKNKRLDFNRLRCPPNRDYLHERFKSYQEAQQ